MREGYNLSVGARNRHGLQAASACVPSGVSLLVWIGRVALTHIVGEKMLEVSREAACSVESITAPMLAMCEAHDPCLPIVIEKADSPIIGLLARITLFVVVCVPLLTVFFLVKMEDQIFIWSSIFSCDPSPVDTTQVLISIDQKSRLVLGVSSVYLCQFATDVAFTCCSIRSQTVLESRCNLTSNLIRRSEGRHARIYGHSSST